jgi:outer membrane protein TolC
MHTQAAATTRIAAIAALIIASSGPAAWAADAPPPGAEPDTAYGAGEPQIAILGLSLDQAKTLAAANNPASRAAVAAVRSARGSMMREAGVFDPVLSASTEHINTDTPSTSPFAGTEIRQRATLGRLSWRSPIGTDIVLSLPRITYESNAPFSTLPIQRTMGARAEFVQPLFRGFGFAATRGDLRAAQSDLSSAEEQLAGATLDLDANVENAYWDLYAAERALEVQRLQRQRAAVFLRDQMLRGRAGVVGPGAVSVARTFLAQQEARLIDARLVAGNAADRLSEVLGHHPDGEARYHVLDEPPAPGDIEPLATVITRAMRANPSLLAARADSAAARHRYSRAAANALPSIDAFGGYGSSGLAGVGQQIIFGADTVGTNFDTGFGSAWDQVTRRDFPDWHLGLRISVPLFWTAERGEKERQRGYYEQAREALRAKQLSLESQVRSAWRAAGDSRRELEATLALVDAATEQARIARLEYQAGRSTAYDLVNIEAELADARFREAAVRVRVAHAATELRRLTTPAPGRSQ